MKTATFGQIYKLDYSGAESLNTICSNLSFSGNKLKKIVVTSCSPGEGKSYMIVQIAQNLAQRGRRVVLVDADLRRSFLIKKHNIKTGGEWIGLAHYLAGYNELEDVVYQTNLKGVYFLPVGRDVANPVPMLDSSDFSNLLNALSERFDLVLVDAPPIGLVIDAAEIAQFCDGCVFVVEYGKTRRRDLQEAKRQMNSAGCTILGCIINKVKLDTISAKKYYNKTYYSHYNSGYYRKSPERRAPGDRLSGR